MNQFIQFPEIKDEFEQFLKSHLPRAASFHPHYETSLQSMLQCGGKRFRPLLLLAVVHARNTLLLPSAMHVALAVECLHTYSLIHDDLPAMDDAAMRRGTPTLHTTYDEVTAILAGDALNTIAFSIIAHAPLADSVKIACVKELADNGGHAGMVLGQALDCHFENEILDVEQLKFLHIHKTAKLIAASLKMGGVIAGMNTELQNKLFTFGINLGLMFQIHDDIIDVTQSSEQAGKDTNNDGDKNSYVNLLGLEGAIKERETLKDSLKSDLSLYPELLQQNLMFLLNKYFI